jgi:hypothetical protein
MLRESGRGRKPVVLAFMLAFAAVGLMGAPASAGQAVFTTFEYELFDNDVYGWGPANTELKVNLRGPGGEYQGHFFVETDSNGFWEDDFWGDINPGDRITATDGSTSRTITVQPLTFQINRVTDVVSGKSVPNSQVEITVYNCYSDWDDCFNTGNFFRNTNGQGNFTYDSTNNYNVRGNDFVYAGWTSPQGDVASRWLDVPSVNVWVGHNEAWGDAKPRQDVTTWLFNSQGNQKAKFKDRANPWYGDYEGFFGKTIRPGDFIGSNIASDALWQIVANNPTFNPGTDVVTGRCFNNKPFTVYAEKQNVTSAFTGGTTNNNGNFSVNLMTQEGYDLESGDIVEIGCKNALGDEQFTDFEVP